MIRTTRQKPGAPRGAANRYEALYAAINSLPERDRALIHQIYWDDKSLRQIARDSGIDVAAISRRHQRILRDLRADLEGTGLDQGRFYDQDGTYWVKCTGCGVWVEFQRDCSCGTAYATRGRVFDFDHQIKHSVNGISNSEDSNENKMTDAKLLARAQADADAWQARLKGRD